MALNNMKTATITFHAPNNNGSFLQAYALQKYITTHFDNVENEIICKFCSNGTPILKSAVHSF